MSYFLTKRNTSIPAGKAPVELPGSSVKIEKEKKIDWWRFHGFWLLKTSWSFFFPSFYFYSQGSSSLLFIMDCAVLSCSVVSQSLRPHGLQPTRLLCLGVSRQVCRSWLPSPPPGDLPNQGIEPRSPTLQADALPSKLSWVTHPQTFIT